MLCLNSDVIFQTGSGKFKAKLIWYDWRLRGNRAFRQKRLTWREIDRQIFLQHWWVWIRAIFVLLKTLFTKTSSASDSTECVMHEVYNQVWRAFLALCLCCHLTSCGKKGSYSVPLLRTKRDLRDSRGNPTENLKGRPGQGYYIATDLGTPPQRVSYKWSWNGLYDIESSLWYVQSHIAIVS